MAAEHNASAYVYQNVGLPDAAAPTDASAYVYQNVGLEAGVESQDASAYVYQNVGLPEAVTSVDATAYTYQNVQTYDLVRAANTTIEVAVYDTDAETRAANETVEVTQFNGDSDVRVANTTIEVSTFGQSPPVSVANVTIEVAGFDLVGNVRVVNETVEVAVYGNGSQPTVVGRTDGKQSGYEYLAPPCWPEAGSGAISSSVPGYVPVPGFYTTPVQIGSVSSLTCARLPSGRIILGWKDGDTFFVAVLEDALDLFRDNVVAPTDRITAFSVPSMRYASLWVDGAGLFAATSYRSGNNMRNECWMATNAENPTNWIMRSRFQDAGIGGGGLIANVDSIGPATITRTGRWVLPGPSYGGYATGTADRSSLWLSENKGLTWTLGPNHRRGPLSSGTTAPISNTIAQDPLTGYLYWSHLEGPLNTGYTFRSMDHGATWSNIASTSGYSAFYTDDGDSKFYAARGGGSGWQAYEVIDPATNTLSNTGISIINSRQSDQFQAIRVGCYLAIIDTNRVAAGRLSSEPMWAIGYT